MTIKAILFDVIGTTVIEHGGDTVVQCFKRAFGDHGVTFDSTVIRANRGKDKMRMIEEVLKQASADTNLSQPIFRSFEVHFTNSLNNFRAREGAAELFAYLKSRGISVGLGSGLSRDLFDKILVHLGWNQHAFDYVGIASEVGKSRPDPAMIFEMMHKLKISSPTEFLKIGDTVADVEEGKNAHVLTAVLLAGTQPLEELERAKPDFLFHGLAELRELIALQPG